MATAALALVLELKRTGEALRDHIAPGNFIISLRATDSE